MFEEPILSSQRRALILFVRKTAADLTEISLLAHDFTPRPAIRRVRPRCRRLIGQVP